MSTLFPGYLPSNLSTTTMTTFYNTSSSLTTQQSTQNNSFNTTTDSGISHPTTSANMVVSTERTTTEEITTQKLTTLYSTNQFPSSQVHLTTQPLNSSSGSGGSSTSASNGNITTNNSTYPGNAEKTSSKSKETGTSIAAIVAPVLALLIISCLAFLIFAGIKRNLLNKIADKMLCSNEEGFFMPIKQFDQAKPLFNRKVKSDYSVYVTDNGDFTPTK